MSHQFQDDNGRMQHQKWKESEHAGPDYPPKYPFAICHGNDTLLPKSQEVKAAERDGGVPSQNKPSNNLPIKGGAVEDDA